MTKLSQPLEGVNSRCCILSELPCVPWSLRCPLTACRVEDELWRGWEWCWHRESAAGKQAVKITTEAACRYQKPTLEPCGGAAKAAGPGLAQGAQIQTQEASSGTEAQSQAGDARPKPVTGTAIISSPNNVFSICSQPGFVLPGLKH